MQRKTSHLSRAAVIAAMYVALTCFQNILFPGSASMAIQFRVSEALCVLCFFTPAGVWGLAVGCLLFNLLYAGALPLDWLVGTAATVLAGLSMRSLRNVTLWGLPLPGLLMPALFNGLLVGWELSVYIGGGFALNAVYVAIGEAVVLLTLGALLYRAILRRKLGGKLFS